MKDTNTLYDFVGDGTLYTNGIMGLISRSMFAEDELPTPSFVYVLYHPRRKKHSWILQKLEEADIPARSDEYETNNDVPKIAYVCFIEEPDFDYLLFEDDDYDTYIEWETGHTMHDIIMAAKEHMEDFDA